MAFDLKEKPMIAIFDPSGENKAFSKLIWSELAGEQTAVKTFDKKDDLLAASKFCLAIFCIIDQPAEDYKELCQELTSDINANYTLIAIETDEENQRLKLKAMGFDSVFHINLADQAEFKSFLQMKYSKALKRFKSYVDAHDYRRFRAALSASPDAFILFNENRKLVYVSKHYQTAYPKIAHKFVEGQDYTDTFRILCEEQNLGPHDPRFNEIASFWEKMDGEYEFKTADSRNWRIRARRLPEDQGHIVTTTDITVYRTQEKVMKNNRDVLEKTLKREKEANEIQKQFINMVTHEFKTPLSIIDGNTQSLIRNKLKNEPDDVEKRAKTIRRAVARLLTMMEGILSSNMLRTGTMDVVLQPVDINKFLNNLVIDYQEIDTSIKIKSNFKNLPSQLMLDKKLFNLVLSNLLSNAIKFSHAGKHIFVEAEYDNTNLIVTIQDNGIGIPAEDLDRIFDRYFRSKESSNIAGTGIGLNLVKDLIDLMEGKIEVESQLGEGTTFKIYIPLERVV